MVGNQHQTILNILVYNNKLLPVRISDLYIYSKTKSIIYATIETLASYVEHSLLHTTPLTCVKFLLTIVEIRGTSPTCIAVERSIAVYLQSFDLEDFAYPV